MKAKTLKLIVICVVFLFIINLSPIIIDKGEVIAEGWSAKSMVVIESQSGRVLYGKDYELKLPMASTTKIVTALTVLENCNDLSKEIQIDNRAVGIPGTSIYLKKGEILTIEELLYGMMLPSGNDAATALAYYVGGDIPTFCNMMAITARNAGAENSSFVNPHGLDECGHYTTALDLAKITAKALQNNKFKKIVSTKSTRIRGSLPGTYRYLKNKNKLLNSLNGCIGVKTGYTDDAGRCLVSACERDFMSVCVVLNCGPMFEESEELLEKAYDNYSNVTILPSYKLLRSIRVVDGKQDNVKVFTRREFKYPLTIDEAKRLEFRYNIPNVLNAPIKKDEVIGELEIYLDNNLLFFEKIYIMDNIQKIGVWSNIKDIISQW